MADERYDFQKFDFHAKRFANSENCERMSAEEVGQYVLLMVRAWLGGKDTTLPDDPVLLARWARSPKVSDSVLAMFPVVETSFGPRRRNDTLFQEWQAAVERSDGGRAKAEARWGAKPVLTSSICTSNATALPTHMPETEPVTESVSETGSGAVTGPDTEPNQKEHSSHVLLANPSGAIAPDPVQAKADYPSFRRAWHGLVKTAGRLSKGRHFVDKYIFLCDTYGAGRVTAAMELWAKRKPDWKWAHDHGHAFNAFVKQLPDVIEELDDDEELPTPTESVAPAEAIPSATPAELANADNVIAQIVADEQRVRAERLKKFRGVVNPNEPQNEGDPMEYLAEATRGK